MDTCFDINVNMLQGICRRKSLDLSAHKVEKYQLGFSGGLPICGLRVD